MQDYRVDLFKKRFLKTTEAIDQINYFESLNLNNIDYEELASQLSTRLQLIPYPSATIPVGSELFRARINPNMAPYNRVDELYIPPIEKVCDFGRANTPGEQIFYSSSNFKLASFEVLHYLRNTQNPHRHIAFLTIGIWEVIKPLHVANIIHSQRTHTLREDIKEAFENGQKILNSGHLNSDSVTCSNLIAQFFSDQFTKADIKTSHDYKFSAFYASTLQKMNKYVAPQYKDERFDGVNYPSVALSYKGDNIAIYKTSADKKLRFKNAIQVVCHNLNFEKGEFTPGIMHEIDSVKEGNLSWKKEKYKPS